MIYEPDLLLSAGSYNVMRGNLKRVWRQKCQHKMAHTGMNWVNNGKILCLRALPVEKQAGRGPGMSVKLDGSGTLVGALGGTN
ncbi:hypothetical protein SAMN02745181_2532 [Rubritalea squalenifaciens DSM 18772]|uniref:Uncharacterized protein n=1 Tax=Rubritalea squalenifaciens DSM 18772 TaxID=1123071 RepID=A0A1M6LXB6_9BACT|nr:hypothetical protein SAMN02745181_2532 [Rubritalea squalenifaciens DSM 18772]